MSTERIDELRTRQFTLARRGGYDQAEVDAYLAGLADWLETDEAKAALAQREIERVGERTGAILSAAQQSADETAAEARAGAESERAGADAYATEARASADQQAAETIREADARLERSEREAAERTATVDAEIAELARKRDAIVANLQELAAGLRAAIDGPGSEDLGLPERSRTAAAFAGSPVTPADVETEPAAADQSDDDEAETRVETVAEHPLVEPEPVAEGAETRPYTPDFDTDEELLDDARPPEPLPSGRDPQRRPPAEQREEPTTDEKKLTELL